MNKYVTWIIVVIILVGGFFLITKEASAPGEYDALATCLKDRGAIFYGAFWCPHCQNQKKMFGPSARLLPYVECSAPDGQSQLPICNQKGIEGYPTWVFPDGSRLTGEVALETLASKANCPLAGAATASSTPRNATSTVAR